MAGEVPIAIVKTSESDKTPPTEIQKCVLDRLGRSYALERVLHLQDLGVEEWPKTTSGKVLKRELQKMTIDLIQREGEQLQNGDHKVERGSLRLSEDELQKYLLGRVQASGILVSTIDDDFHNAGMDSLLALQLRNSIVKNVDLGDKVALPANVIFEAGNIRDLAARLIAVNSGNEDSSGSVNKMAALVERYSDFRPHASQGHTPEMHTIVRHCLTHVLRECR